MQLSRPTLLRLLSLFSLLSLLPLPSLCQNGFSILTQSTSLPFNGRSSAGLVSLPYSITYSNFSYVVNATTPATTYALVNNTNPPGLFDPNTGALATSVPLTASTPRNSLFLWGGGCGHNINTISVLGDPDVWSSADGGYTWTLVAGAHGLSGSYEIYVQALSASTPYWSAGTSSGPTTALYPPQTVTAPATYPQYPNSLPLHDPIHSRFYLLGGEAYPGSGHWVPAAEVVTSGGTPINSTSNNATLNLEATGWTTGVLTSAGVYQKPASATLFSARSSAAGAVDSQGNVYLLNGISAYSFTDDFAQTLLADVWVSTTQGVTWTAQNTNPPWANQNNATGRFESGAVSYYSAYYGVDLLYMLGGCSTNSTNFTGSGVFATVVETGYNDVYVSANGGVTWTNVTLNAAWSGRCGMTAAVTTGGVMAVVGGRGPLTYTSTTYPNYYTTTLGTSTLTDIWTSLDGGYTWYQLSATGGRDRPAITFDVNGYLHIVAGRVAVGEGYSATGCPSDSYVSSQSFNNISSWITTVPGLSSAVVPSATGLRSLAGLQPVRVSSTAAPSAAASTAAARGSSSAGSSSSVVVPASSAAAANSTPTAAASARSSAAASSPTSAAAASSAPSSALATSPAVAASSAVATSTPIAATSAAAATSVPIATTSAAAVTSAAAAAARSSSPAASTAANVPATSAPVASPTSAAAASPTSAAAASPTSAAAASPTSAQLYSSTSAPPTLNGASVGSVAWGWMALLLAAAQVAVLML